ncbi:porin [Polynucleobacter sp. 80A-SIGWE]|uniref:porin n=1 Tax=Polynucleobacter sp. 80A-SIGWE TaxID=2689100 RepID=UPI001C0E0616|nr:porin [Polynucleobacter sp. 80A-SIGWE]MBU3588891.1 porin [Polynucleobacter sp. 80A-SIGWE]
MKKSLFAIAAVTAFAGAAQAQSSVTVYGILDAGYVGGNERAASSTAVNKGTWSALQTSGAESSNRLGFKGVEDLGGGNSAIFTIETSLNASTDAWAPTFRQAFGGLKKNGVGQVRLGTQNSLIWQAAAATTTGQLNNITGSVLNPTTVVGNSASPSAQTNSGNGTNIAFTNRTQRTLQLESERFAGFVGKAMVVLNNANTTQTNLTGVSQGYTGGENNQNGWGLGADYVWQKLNVQAAYQSFNAANPYNATQAQVNAGAGYTSGTPAAFGANGLSVGAASNVRDNQAYIAATYDFGILKAYAGWTSRSVTSQQTSAVQLKRQAQEIGVRSFITPTIEAWASVGNGRYTAFGAGEPTANITGYQIGGNYLLSKRTNLYAIFGAAGTSNASTTAVAADSSNVNNYAIGMRHSF